eukprot:352178-Chlamydomonas_euryale.AAC.7
MPAGLLPIPLPAACRKPSLEGRFSGRLPTKEDEKRVVEECKLLAPLLGGQGKHGDATLVTLAKLVRGIAAGDVRSYCEQRERTIVVLQERVTQLEAATGLRPHSDLMCGAATADAAGGSGDAMAMMQRQLEIKDAELRVLRKKLAARDAQFASMRHNLDLLPKTIRSASAAMAPHSGGNLGGPDGALMVADPKAKAKKRTPGASPRGSVPGPAAAASSAMVSEDCCSTVPEMHTVTTLGSSILTTGTSSCCCPERHPVLSQRMLRGKDEPDCDPCAPGAQRGSACGVPAAADAAAGMRCAPLGDLPSVEHSRCSRGGESDVLHAQRYDPCCAGSGSPSPAGTGACGPRGCGPGGCGPSGLELQGSARLRMRDRSASLCNSLGDEMTLATEPVTRHMQMLAARSQHARHRSAYAMLDVSGAGLSPMLVDPSGEQPDAMMMRRSYPMHSHSLSRHGAHYGMHTPMAMSEPTPGGGGGSGTYASLSGSIAPSPGMLSGSVPEDTIDLQWLVTDLDIEGMAHVG